MYRGRTRRTLGSPRSRLVGVALAASCFAGLAATAVASHNPASVTANCYAPNYGTGSQCHGSGSNVYASFNPTSYSAWSGNYNSAGGRVQSDGTTNSKSHRWFFPSSGTYSAWMSGSSVFVENAVWANIIYRRHQCYNGSSAVRNLQCLGWWD